jgi:predicted phage-related endonuclease
VIYEKKRIKLLDVMSEIKRFEAMIKNIQNVIENILKPQSTAISQTYSENYGKLKKLN